MVKNGSYVGLTACFLCGKGDKILIHKHLSKVFPDHGKLGCIDTEPCTECAQLMKQGIILISFDESKTDMSSTVKIPNPAKTSKSDGLPDMVDTGTPNFYRTGGWCVVREEAVARMPIEQEYIDAAIRRRVLFLTDEAWDALGLPREDYNPADPVKDKVTMHYEDCRYAREGNTTRIPERVTCKLCHKRRASDKEEGS